MQRKLLSSSAVLLILSIFGPQLAASICLPQVTAKDDPRSYISALIAALGAAKEGIGRADTASSPDSDDPLAAARAFMTSMKLAQRDLDCAASHVEGYTKSNNRAIKTSADGSVFVFNALRDINKKTVAYYRDMLDGKVAADALGSVAEELAETSAALDDVWKTLPIATAAATYALVKFDKSGVGAARLVLTEAERQQLRAELHDTFGADIENGVQTGQISLVAAAAMLYEFLGNSEWRSADYQH